MREDQGLSDAAVLPAVCLVAGSLLLLQHLLPGQGGQGAGGAGGAGGLAGGAGGLAEGHTVAGKGELD